MINVQASIVQENEPTIHRSWPRAFTCALRGRRSRKGRSGPPIRRPAGGPPSQFGKRGLLFKHPPAIRPAKSPFAQKFTWHIIFRPCWQNGSNRSRRPEQANLFVCAARKAKSLRGIASLSHLEFSCPTFITLSTESVTRQIRASIFKTNRLARWTVI